MRTSSVRVGAFVSVALGLAASAGAAQVVFENLDGVFQFVPQTAPFLSSQGWLDITQDKFQGPGAPDFHKVTLLAQPAATSLHFTRFSLLGNASSFIAGGGDPLQGYTGDEFIGFTPQAVASPKSFPLGGSVSSAETFGSVFALSVKNPTGAPVAEDGFASSDAIVGLSIFLSGQAHYGFVALRPMRSETDFLLYQPIAWGYESTPGAPFILIPAPGAAAIAGLAGAAALRRRRR